MVSKVSNWWYLVPIIAGLFGGIVAYFAIRPRDKKKAKNLLYVGIAIFIITVGYQGLALGLQIGALNIFTPLSMMFN